MAERTTRRRTTLLVLLLAVCAPALGRAQYFGQKKVQYERFDFQVMRTESFDIYYYPEEAEAVRRLAPVAEQWRARLARDLGFDLRGRQPLVLYASHPHFRQTQAIQGLVGEGTGGVTEFLKRRMVMPFASSLGETSHVLGHELVHAFQFDGGGQQTLALPLWFIEGMAEYLTLGDDAAFTAMWLRDLARQENLPTFADLTNPRYFPYRFGHAAWAYLAARFGPGVVGDVFVAASRTGDHLGAIEAVTGQGIDELSADWHAEIRRRHGRPADAADAAGRVLLTGDERRGGRLNVSPAISPDGRWIAYLSERGLFSIDLYLADATTGEVVRRLTRTETDPHFEALQFVGSAGGWDRDSRRLAFVAISGGTPTLTVVDVGPGGRTREWRLEDVDEAWHPTWSPDGGSIAFSALRGGVSDLYVLDVGSGAVRQLTDDAYADQQPAFAPDGQRLAFVSDRPGAGTTTAGALRLAMVSLASPQIESLPALPGGPHLNPAWDADGTGLYLIASPDDVANVHHLDLRTGTFTRITDVHTGVSGITATSPALSYAPQANQLAFSVFRNGGHDIHVLSPGGDRLAAATERRAGVLFGATSDVGTALAVDTAVAEAPPAPVESYRPALSLDFAGAAGGIGMASRYGSFVGGGLGLQFSDMLGDHNLGVVVEANGGVRDIGGQVTYLNRESRWNWGGAVLMRPYVAGGFSQRLSEVDGRTLLLTDEYLFRQTDAELRGLAFYPFNRAFRFELQAGGRRMWFSRRLTTRAYSPITGEYLGDQRQDLDAPSALNLGEASAALVYDQSVFGPTSPISGQRHRLEVTPTLGSLRFTTVTADLRRYITLWRPFTLAVRGLHVGRYGRDSDDLRLTPLFLGYPSLVRGYGVGSFNDSECGSSSAGDCPAFDELLGSRVALGNAELRFALPGAFTGRYDYGPLPIEGFLFADSGVAWNSQVDPTFAGGQRRFVSSVGVGARANLFGYLVGEIAVARPLDRPGRGWVLSFNLMPGY